MKIKTLILSLFSLLAASSLSAALPIVPSSNAQADNAELRQTPSKIIYATETPFKSDVGYMGYDLYSKQSVAIRFQIPQDSNTAFRLDSLGLWMFEGLQPVPGKIEISLRTNNNSSISSGIPSEEILESWTVTLDPLLLSAPELVQVKPLLNHELKKDEYYWIVAHAITPDIKTKQWAISRSSQVGSYMALELDGTWHPIASDTSMLPSVVVMGSPINTQ